ncbi:hypothetical protein H696_00320 [Fonticula alba]|uniref:Cytosolic Fe-S cluster assembly factor NUBP1 homolog n=1 Tax=Fonticula alba TaxID=691883 RepID=A0A058ZFL0_FONAL|nr:hypothetical protein H696_00320 [Fonticula alba]KCV72741.1 hypothetical protein H696_00320 [Fonticula alba]|eukprot:XP_009492442.1 hypothetical protein H696_00320 [Fonticula alba]
MSTAELSAPPPQDCPGTSSEAAGKMDACAGCPNQRICASSPPQPAVDPDAAAIAERMLPVRHRVLVLSGKGGVGKSTVSSQLAWMLSRGGFDADPNAGDDAAGGDDDMDLDPDPEADAWDVGLVDIDITGPSAPRLLGAGAERLQRTASGLSPVFVSDTLFAVSVGFMLERSDDAVIWRGPKKNGLIKQFLRDVDYQPTDVLLVDTPPGTSDEHISIVQLLKQANEITAQHPEAAATHAGSKFGAVIVTTPQEVALADVRRELNFCRRVGLPVLGIIENMAGFVCPGCSINTDIFPATTGGARSLAQDFDVPFLGSIPIDPRVAKACDEGRPIADACPTSPATIAMRRIANKLKEVLES